MHAYKGIGVSQRDFKANTWEEIRMLAEKNEVIDECVCTLAELSKDDKIRMQTEAYIKELMERYQIK